MIKIFKSFTSVIVKVCEAVESFVSGCHNFIKLFEEVSEDALKEHKLEAADARAQLQAKLKAKGLDDTTEQ